MPAETRKLVHHWTVLDVVEDDDLIAMGQKGAQNVAQREARLAPRREIAIGHHAVGPHERAKSLGDHQSSATRRLDVEQRQQRTAEPDASEKRPTRETIHCSTSPSSGARKRKV